MKTAYNLYENGLISIYLLLQKYLIHTHLYDMPVCYKHLSKLIIQTSQPPPVYSEHTNASVDKTVQQNKIFVIIYGLNYAGQQKHYSTPIICIYNNDLKDTMK
jgi:hypothetical protein